MSTKLAGVAAAELVPQNASRKSFVFQNEDVADTIYLKKERPKFNRVRNGSRL